jgi:hypothetical protein
MSRRAAATHGDAGTPKLMAHGGPGNAQLSTDQAEALTLAYKSATRLTSTRANVTAQSTKTWSAVLVIGCVGSARRIR